MEAELIMLYVKPIPRLIAQTTVIHQSIKNLENVLVERNIMEY